VEIYNAFPFVDHRKALVYTLAAPAHAVGWDKQPLAWNIFFFDRKNNRIRDKYTRLKVFGVRRIPLAGDLDGQELGCLAECILETHRRDDDVSRLVDMEPVTPRPGFIILRKFSVFLGSV